MSGKLDRLIVWVGGEEIEITASFDEPFLISMLGYDIHITRYGNTEQEIEIDMGDDEDE